MALLLAFLAQAGIDWRTDYDAARGEAREKGRRILVQFFMPTRPVFREMDAETFSQAEVARIVRDRFVGVRVDVDLHPDLFQSMIGSRGVFATCVVDADGDVISELRGYAGPEVFLRFLEKAESGTAAIRSAREALKEAPEDSVRLYALGEAYRDSGSPRRAEDCYRKAIRGKGPEAATAPSHERLARLSVMRGWPGEARAHLNAARTIDPDGRSTSGDRMLLTEGLILAVERKHEEASVVLRDALKRFPSSAEADHVIHALGFVLHQSSRDADALKVFEDGLTRFPKSAWAAAMKEQVEHIKNPQPDHTH